MNKLLRIWNKLSFLVKLLIIIIIVVVIRYLYLGYLLRSTITENFGNPVSCTYYYMNNCGHCKRFTPEWDDFVQSYTGNIKLRKVEASDAGDDLQKYNIKGFPTVLLIDDAGETKEFNGPRTSDGLKTFLQN